MKQKLTKVTYISCPNNELDMGNIKPSINAKGFKTAVKDYTESSIIEELAANSYDAYASTVLVLLDEIQNKIYVLDDGKGFDEKSIKEIMTLGGGNKIYADPGERIYLGSYGYGLKAVVTIATTLKVITCSEEDGRMFSTEIDLNQLEAMMVDGVAGYPYQDDPLPSESSKGTAIILTFKNPTTKKELDAFGKSLGNLPTDNGKFNCFYGFYRDVKADVAPFLKNYQGLS